MFLKSCGLPAEGKRIEDQEEADASERESSPARWGGAQVQYISSEASPPPRFWAAARERGPAVMASRPEPVQPVNTQLLTA